MYCEDVSSDTYAGKHERPKKHTKEQKKNVINMWKYNCRILRNQICIYVRCAIYFHEHVTWFYTFCVKRHAERKNENEKSNKHPRVSYNRNPFSVSCKNWWRHCAVDLALYYYKTYNSHTIHIALHFHWYRWNDGNFVKCLPDIKSFAIQYRVL